MYYQQLLSPLLSHNIPSLNVAKLDVSLNCLSCLLLFLVFVLEVMKRNFLLVYIYILKCKNVYDFIIIEDI